jgi:prophage regulatory protein
VIKSRPSFLRENGAAVQDEHLFNFFRCSMKPDERAPIDGIPPSAAAAAPPRRPSNLIRLPEVERRIGLKRTSIYKAVKAGTLPAPVRVSERLTAWREEDIDRWIEQRVSTRTAP